MKTALLLKTKSQPFDPYVEAFEKYGRDTAFIPVLRHKRVHEEQLRDKLKNVRKTYCGLIVTSQRVSETLDEALKQEDETERQKILMETPIFTVGPATDDSIRRLGFQQTHGKDCGRGEVLADLIEEWYTTTKQHKPLLFLVGEKHRDIIQRKLGDDRVDSLIVYATQELENTETQIKDTIRKHPTIDWIVAFSPTSICSLLNTFELKIATIGPTTGDYLKKLGIQPNVVSPAPNPESLASSIVAFDEENSS